MLRSLQIAVYLTRVSFVVLTEEVSLSKDLVCYEYLEFCFCRVDLEMHIFQKVPLNISDHSVSSESILYNFVPFVSYAEL